MQKLTDMIVSALLKKGVMMEARNIKADMDLPGENAGIVTVTIDHVSIHFDKDKKEEA